MEVSRIEEGLWRWTAPLPGPCDGRDGAPELVGCAFVDTGAEIVVVDPLVPRDPDDRERFHRALDRDVERAGSPPTVVLTVRRHAWSAAEIRDRYPGARVLAPDDARRETLARTPVDGWVAPGADLPAGIRAIAAADPGELVLWLAAHRALVAGDVVRGIGAGRLALADAADPARRAHAVAALRPLLALGVERVLPSHGEPVPAGGRAALAALLHA